MHSKCLWELSLIQSKIPWNTHGVDWVLGTSCFTLQFCSKWPMQKQKSSGHYTWGLDDQAKPAGSSERQNQCHLEGGLTQELSGAIRPPEVLPIVSYEFVDSWRAPRTEELLLVSNLNFPSWNVLSLPLLYWMTLPESAWLHNLYKCLRSSCRLRLDSPLHSSLEKTNPDPSVCPCIWPSQ